MPLEEKKTQLEDLKKLFNRYKVICLVDMLKMPTKQMQIIKKSLGGKVLVKFSKKSLVEFAMKETGKDLIGNLPKQPALIFSDLDPFTLFKEIDNLRFKTYAKEGYVATENIEVKPGPTELLPGPAISELQKVGLTAGVEGGKIAIKKPSTVLKKGQIVTKELSGVLRKLKLQVAEITLNVDAIFDGILYKKDTLELVKQYPSKMKEYFKQALNLSLSINYPTKENIKYLLVKAYQRVKALEKKIGE
ncbi:MAG: 50S ribosomal protein L10 [Candidatus Aenigmarchaeota archaeon]|nr:50S ribosomal protein L10 [Candidatus Aenigmarchaeota archaeon]